MTGCSILLTAHAGLTAQNQIPVSTELDQKFSPPENSLFKSKRKATAMDPEDLRFGFRYLPFELLRGNLQAEVEMNLFDEAFVLTAGIGYHLASDYLSSLGNVISYDNASIAESTLPDKYVLKSGTMLNGGPVLSVGFKRYFREFLSHYWSAENAGDPFRCPYTFFRYTYYPSEYALPGEYRSVPIRPAGPYHLNTHLFSVGIGYSFLSGASRPLQHDFYVGFGIKWNNSTNYTMMYESVYDPVYGVYNQEAYYGQNGSHSEFKLGAITLGYAIGICY